MRACFHRKVSASSTTAIVCTGENAFADEFVVRYNAYHSMNLPVRHQVSWCVTVEE